MADTQQEAPAQHVPELNSFGSLSDATNAFLGLMESEDQPETPEATTTDEEESTDEVPDESLEAVSEDESEEEASESEEPQDDEEEPELDAVYALKVDGEEVEVTLDELLKGYSRNSSYTQKSQALAEDRKQMEALQSQYASEMQQIQAEREQYAQQLQSMIENSNLNQFANVDWERLKVEDPIEFVTKREEFREAQEKIAKVQQQQQTAIQKNEAAAQQQWQESVKQEHAALVEKLPEWGDPEKQRSLSGKLRTYASSAGFQDAEIDSLIDHRSFVILNKARLYDEMVKANPKAKKLKNKPKVIRGNKTTSAKAEAKSKRAALRNRLQETGHPRDAAALLEDFVNI